MLSRSFAITVGVGLSMLSLAACQTQPGNPGSEPAHSAGANDKSRVEHCEQPIGLASLAQPGDATLERLESLELGSPLPFLRMAMVKSNCFQVVDLEAVANSELADEIHFAIRPQITLNNPDAGGVGGIGDLTRMFGVSGTGEAGGDITVQEVKAVLFLSDARTGLLKLAAEGSATAHDLSGLAIGDYGGLSGEQKTAEGELFAAAFLDALNNLVIQIRDQSGPMVTAGNPTS